MTEATKPSREPTKKVIRQGTLKTWTSPHEIVEAVEVFLTLDGNLQVPRTFGASGRLLMMAVLKSVCCNVPTRKGDI